MTLANSTSEVAEVVRAASGRAVCVYWERSEARRRGSRPAGAEAEVGGKGGRICWCAVMTGAGLSLSLGPPGRLPMIEGFEGGMDGEGDLGGL